MKVQEQIHEKWWARAETKREIQEQTQKQSQEQTQNNTGGLSWYMISSKGQHASSDIARNSKHTQFNGYMREFRRLGDCRRKGFWSLEKGGMCWWKDRESTGSSHPMWDVARERAFHSHFFGTEPRSKRRGGAYTQYWGAMWGVVSKV